MATININVDETVKQQANELFKSLGLDMTTALNLFLRQAIHYGGIPFEIRKPHPCSVSSDEELLMKLKEAEESIAKDGHILSHDDFWKKMREKYGNNV